MCGRYTIKGDLTRLGSQLGLANLFDLSPRYNVAPAQPVPIITHERQIRMMHWGLVPHWAGAGRSGRQLINARAESVATRPAFRHTYRDRRCLVPADGFYEWKTMPGRVKQPYYIARRDGQPMCFAGLWEPSTDEQGQPVETCTLITTDANDLLRPIHDRMPVILEPEAYARWLDTPADAAASLADLLRPIDSDTLKMHPVTRRVSNPDAEGPELIAPVETEPGTLFDG